LNPLKLNELAYKTGFIRRQSKLKPEEFIETLIFSDQNHSLLSLQDCCNDLAQQRQKSLSKVALHNRFNERSLDFLKGVLAEQMASKLELGTGNNWQPFSRVLIADSCKFHLPEMHIADYPGFGGRNALSLMNIQYAFDLKHGDWENLELTKATQNDQSQSKKTLDRIRKNELHIRDMGFITMPYLKKIVKEEAFFLNRLPGIWKPIQCDTEKAIDWTVRYQEMQNSKEACFETMVTIGKNKDAFCCRLIAVPVPEQVWAERIRRAQIQAKGHGWALSEEYKERCRFSVFITNVGEQVLNTDDVIQLYRLRWQIELVFKTWKSLLSIHKVKAVKKIRLECQLVAKFIWILINWKIFKHIDAFIQKNSPGYACSIWKFFKQIPWYKHALRKVVNGDISFKNWCEIFIFPIIKNLLLEPKKGKKPAFDIVFDIFNP
jgi:hypothetical protein